MSKILAVPYKRCCRCIMDTSALDIRFDQEGNCNFCTDFLSNSKHILKEDSIKKRTKLEGLVNKIKRDGIGKQYDCIIGVSGGVDSSWALVQAHKLGLRILAVHMDNGWNSELAQSNIENLIRALGVDLYTHVINWQEYRDLMQAFFDAKVIDIELLYDNAMMAVNYAQAKKFGVRYILSGSNYSTEGMAMPLGWNWMKLDRRNIYGIAKKFGNIKIKTFESIGVLKWLYLEYFKHIRWIPFLDYFDFNKSNALIELEYEFSYRRYPYKHYESIFTRFYQGYILPNKFKVDKRLVHLSTLIVSGQMNREDALKILKESAYQSKQEENEDIQYFLKKMGWTTVDLEKYIAGPCISHALYPSEDYLYKFAKKIRSIMPDAVLKYLKS